MGNNTEKYDRVLSYKVKTTNQLQQLLKDAEDFVVKYPQFELGHHNEYIQRLKMLIAERIGK
jgi:hypothetical protein